MQETDAVEEPLCGSNKTDENVVYYSHNKELESVQDEVLDLSLGNVSLQSVPQILNKFGLDLTVKKNKNGDNTTIFDDNNYFIKNHVYKLLPITFEEIDQELIYKEHDYCSISSGSDKEEGFSKTMEISLIKNRVYRRKREKSAKKRNKNAGFKNCQENNSPDSIDTIQIDMEKDSQLEELDFSQINLHAKTLMYHSEVDFSKLLQPIDLTPNFSNQKYSEKIAEDNDDGPCSPESHTPEINRNDIGKINDDNPCSPESHPPEINRNDIAEDNDDNPCSPESHTPEIHTNDIVVEMMRPNCKDYRPCKRFLYEVSQLVPLLNKSGHGKINILDLSSENVGGNNGHKTYYCIYEDTWKMFQCSDRMILTNDRSICTPIGNYESDGTPTYLLFDEDSLQNALAKHSQDIGASLNYQFLKDYNGELTESNIIPEILEIDDSVDGNLEFTILENEIEATSVDEHAGNGLQPGGIINSGLLQRLLSKSRQIKCNECLEEADPCSKCMESMSKTFVSKTSQNSDKYYKLSAKKHWNRMVSIKNIFDSNPIVKEMKSKKGYKKKELKGKSSKKKPSASNEKTNSNDLEPQRNEKSGGIINSGFLKAFLMNSSNSLSNQNNLLACSSTYETTKNLVSDSNVDNLKQVSTFKYPGPLLYGSSSFVELDNAVEKPNAINADALDDLPKNNSGNRVTKKMVNSAAGYSLEEKGEPNLNNENIPDLETGTERKKKSAKPSTLKKPRRSLEISIEEIADLALGVEKRTRSGREAPQVLVTKNQPKKRSINNDCRGKNSSDTKNKSGSGEELVSKRVKESETDTESILNSLLLDAARKISEPSETPILCDILPNMENLNIPITKTNLNSMKTQNKLLGAEKKKVSNEKRKRSKLNSKVTPDNNNPDVDSNKEVKISDTSKNQRDEVEDSSEQDVLFFENNLNQDESNKSLLELKEMCKKLENNTAAELGMLSNGLNNISCNGYLENGNDLEINENNDVNHTANNNSSFELNTININVGEKNDESNEAMLRFKNTISEKMKNTASHRDKDCSNSIKNSNSESRRHSSKSTDSNVNASDCNNEKTVSTKKENNVIFLCSNHSKTILGDIEADLQEINNIKKEANELQKIKVNDNKPKNSKNDFKNQESKKPMVKSSASVITNHPIIPLRNRLRSNTKDGKDATCSKIEEKDINEDKIQDKSISEKNRHPKKNLKRKESVVEGSGSSKKRRSSRETTGNMLGTVVNGNVKTSHKKVNHHPPLGGASIIRRSQKTCINSPLENKQENKSCRDSVSHPSNFTYERTTRSGKAILSSTAVKNSKTELPAKKKHHELILLNIEEVNLELIQKKEINLRRRTIDCSFSSTNKEQTEENVKDEVALKKRKSVESKIETNKNEKPKPRFSERLRNK